MVVQLRVVITPMLRSPEARGKVTGTPSPVIWGLDPRRDRVVSCEKQDQGGGSRLVKRLPDCPRGGGYGELVWSTIRPPVEI
jgi:hypothetical protein